jgi:hypothetical protein
MTLDSELRSVARIALRAAGARGVTVGLYVAFLVLATGVDEGRIRCALSKEAGTGIVAADSYRLDSFGRPVDRSTECVSLRGGGGGVSGRRVRGRARTPASCCHDKRFRPDKGRRGAGTLPGKRHRDAAFRLLGRPCKSPPARMNARCAG